MTSVNTYEAELKLWMVHCLFSIQTNGPSQCQELPLQHNHFVFASVYLSSLLAIYYTDCATALPRLGQKCRLRASHGWLLLKVPFVS